MRIAIWHNLPSGGGKRALYDHIKGLVELGHHVEAWCPSTADINFLPLRDIIPEHVIPLEWPTNLGSNRKWDLTYDYRLITKQLRVMEAHCSQCAQEITDAGFDILISHPCMFFATSPIGMYVNLPKILYLQEPKRKLYEGTPLLPWQALDRNGYKNISPTWIRKYFTNLLYVQGLREQLRQERANAAAYDSILVNSFYSRESILRAYGIDSKVCYLGIDTDRFVNKNLQKENMVIGVGAFTKNKNIKFVIKAVSKLRFPRPRLVWVGNMPNEKYINDLSKMATDLSVEFIPRVLVTDNELIDLNNSAKVMVYAPRLEPFGFTPLEANACGTPVVAVAEGGVRETVVNGRNGFLVENSEQAMSDAIQTLLDQPELAATLGEMGRKWVEEKWTLESSIQRLLDRIYEVIPEKRR